MSYQSMTFGQIMRGDRLVSSLYDMHFKQPKQRTKVCERLMAQGDIDMLHQAIDDNYLFEIYVADLPVVRPVGIKVRDEQGNFRYLLVHNLDFHLGHNHENVVQANITTEIDLMDITHYKPGFSVPFSYSVSWYESNIPFEQRLQMQLTGSLTATQSLDIHWLAIVNSFVLVLLIVSLLVLIILRVVRSDLSKVLHIPDEELAGSDEESGWKLLHADVFRAPPHRMWFCACIGAGTQLVLMVVGVVVVGCFGIYFERGAILTAAGACYVATSFISGYISAFLYRRLGGQKWAWNILITALAFVGPAFIIWCFLNTVAWVYKSTAAIPALTVVFLLATYLLITLPLTVFGGIVGRNHATKMAEKGSPWPCKTNKLAREIPQTHWYYSPWAQMFAAGFLPFSAIYIELHYIFSSVWGPKVYSLYGILLLSFIMLLLVAATISVLLTYFHLNAEDHRWWWRSLGSGGSVAFFFYLYCAYYFSTSTRMFGFLQVSFFFGYSLLLAWGMFLLVGCVTFFSTYTFVNYIYQRAKSE
eukprot:GDKI01030793.1.p1 GENE.GDKI01030793.1~~GDKI01030793.1.p1  ORF type:complete len:574 (+),score=123.34 GDKI01030793.1:135-1724(+)